MSSEELKLMPMPSLGEFIDWVWQLKEDYAALEAECERLVEDVKKWQALAQNVETLERVTESAEARRAQLAAIQGGMGEAMEPDITTGRGYPAYSVEAVQRITAAMAAEVERLREERDSFQRAGIRATEERDRDAAARDQYRALSIKYGDKLSETLKECDALRAELEALRKDASAEMFLTLTAELAKLRSELAAIKGQEPALWFRSLIGAQCKPDGRCYDVVFSPCEGFMPLYALPPVSPDVEGLVKALEEVERRNDNPARFDADIDRIVTDALSTWRQAQEGNP